MLIQVPLWVLIQAGIWLVAFFILWRQARRYWRETEADCIKQEDRCYELERKLFDLEWDAKHKEVAGKVVPYSTPPLAVDEIGRLQNQRLENEVEALKLELDEYQDTIVQLEKQLDAAREELNETERANGQSGGAAC